MAGPSFVVRVKEEQERALYGRHLLYIGIRRDWSKGSKIMFVKKASEGDMFIGSGTVERIIGLADMDEVERAHCFENNWYGKMVFENVAKFHPVVSVQGTPFADRRPALLHGLAATDKEISAVERLVVARLIF